MGKSFQFLYLAASHLQTVDQTKRKKKIPLLWNTTEKQ
jgi:hypothetical protein